MLAAGAAQPAVSAAGLLARHAVQAGDDRPDRGLVDIRVDTDAEHHVAIAQCHWHVRHGDGVGAFAHGLLIVVVDLEVRRAELLHSVHEGRDRPVAVGDNVLFFAADAHLEFAVNLSRVRQG